MTLFPRALRFRLLPWFLGLALLFLLASCKPSLRDVKNTDDPAELEAILHETEDADVIAAAIAKIDDPTRLEDIATNNALNNDQRDAAQAKLDTLVLTITDDRVLSTIQFNGQTPDARAAATMLRSTNSVPERDEAFDAITDPAMLEAIVHGPRTIPIDLRKRAVSRLSDPAATLRILEADLATPLRRAALARIDDTATLLDLYQREADDDLREDMLRRIDDQTILAAAAQGDGPDTLRRTALDRLTDAGALTAIALDDANAHHRAIAAFRVADAQARARIARDATDPLVRFIAAAEAPDRKHLLAMSDPAKDEWTDLNAVRALETQDPLRHFALEHDDPSVRAAAVGKLEDRDVLAEIVTHDPDSTVVWRATRRVLALDHPDMADDIGHVEPLQRLLLSQPVIDHHGALRLDLSQTWRDVAYSGGHTLRVQTLSLAIDAPDGTRLFEGSYEGTPPDERAFLSGKTEADPALFDMQPICDLLLAPLDPEDKAGVLARTSERCR